MKLNFTKGLHKARYLSEKEKNKARSLNEPNNIGVESVLNKENVILVFHDTKFRKPTRNITKKAGNEIIFPPVPFPEIKGAISSSPSKKLHRHLSKNIRVKKDWASLLIGY